MGAGSRVSCVSWMQYVSLMLLFVVRPRASFVSQHPCCVWLNLPTRRLHPLHTVAHGSEPKALVGTIVHLKQSKP